MKDKDNTHKHCDHYFTERFDIGPKSERWFSCVFCKHKKKNAQ